MLNCTSPVSVAFNTNSALNNLDERIVACFNYQQELAKKRHTSLENQIGELEERIRRLESRLR